MLPVNKMKKVYRTKNKLIWKRASDSIILCAIAIVFFLYDLFFNESVTPFSFYLLIPIALSFCIHFNYLLNDKNKTIVIDTSTKTIQLTIDKKTQEYSFDDIKKIYHMRGRKDESRVHALPHMFYHYFKFCTEKEVFTLTNLSIDETPLYSKTEEKISLLNFVTHNNLWKEEQKVIE